jgi:peroxiredoxin
MKPASAVAASDSPLLERGMNAVAGQRITTGQQFPGIFASTVPGGWTSVPSGEPGHIHLQFLRFAGCPVCHLHLRTFAERHLEIHDAGIREVVVFHSDSDELLPHEGQFPFDVIADPRKVFYRDCGVGTSFSALRPGVWPTFLKGIFAGSIRSFPWTPTGGWFGLPADFLIAADGTVKAAYYGEHANDHWSVDEVLGLAWLSAF